VQETPLYLGFRHDAFQQVERIGRKCSQFDDSQAKRHFRFHAKHQVSRDLPQFIVQQVKLNLFSPLSHADVWCMETIGLMCPSKVGLSSSSSKLSIPSMSFKSSLSSSGSHTVTIGMLAALLS
jgi:hypothetical protein